MDFLLSSFQKKEKEKREFYRMDFKNLLALLPAPLPAPR
jgi:hypothetical protein